MDRSELESVDGAGLEATEVLVDSLTDRFKRLKARGVTSRPPASWQDSPLFCVHRLEHLDVQRLIGDQALQAAILALNDFHQCLPPAISGSTNNGTVHLGSA